MSFIAENGDFQVTDGAKTLFSTTQRQPHIVGKAVGTITCSNLSVQMYPLLLLNTGGVVLTSLYLGFDEEGYVHTVNNFFSKSQGRFFILPFFRSNYSGAIADDAGVSNPGNTANRWIYSPGGLLVRVYGLSIPWQQASETPTGYVGALSVNVVVSPTGLNDSLVVVARNYFWGAGNGPGIQNPFFPTTEYGSSVKTLTAAYTDATIDYVVYYGRF